MACQESLAWLVCRSFGLFCQPHSLLGLCKDRSWVLAKILATWSNYHPRGTFLRSKPSLLEVLTLQNGPNAHLDVRPLKPHFGLCCTWAPTGMVRIGGGGGVLVFHHSCNMTLTYDQAKGALQRGAQTCLSEKGGEQEWANETCVLRTSMRYGP